MSLHFLKLFYTQLKWQRHRTQNDAKDQMIFCIILLLSLHAIWHKSNLHPPDSSFLLSLWCLIISCTSSLRHRMIDCRCLKMAGVEHFVCTWKKKKKEEELQSVCLTHTVKMPEYCMWSLGEKQQPCCCCQSRSGGTWVFSQWIKVHPTHTNTHLFLH